MQDNITLSDEEYAELIAQTVEPPPDNPQPEAESFWVPSLTPKQMEAFFDESENTLTVGNRFTGKGWACGYNVVKHAYDYYDAMVVVIVKTKRQGTTGGFFTKLGSEILPDFERNIKGFSYKGPYLTIEKDVVYSVTNRYGGKSLIQLISIQHDNDLQRKIKGIEASKVYIDEITLFETDEVVVHLGGTLKRRKHVPRKAQTILASCNPDDPDHWVAKMWGLVLLADGTLDEAATNAKDPHFRVISIMREDNPDPGVHDYYEGLKRRLVNRPTLYARDVDGKWVAMPQGDSIFMEVFVPDVHVRGDKRTEEYLSPVPGLPIYIGMDPGDKNHGVVFLQEVVTQHKILWMVFDELVHVSKMVNLQTLTHGIMKKMQYWCEACDFNFSFTGVSDRSAYDRWRAPTGSTDLQEMLKHYAGLRDRYPRVPEKLKIQPCPKPEGSVEMRVRIVHDLLSREELYISANCENVIEMFHKITPKKDNPFTPGTHSKYKHALDALSYPIYWLKTGGSPVPQTGEVIRPQVLRVGVDNG